MIALPINRPIVLWALLSLVTFGQNTPQVLDGDDFYTLENFESVPKFDSHVHINTRQRPYLELARKNNFQFLNIVDDRPFGLSMDDQQEVAFHHLKSNADQLIVATTFSVDEWDSPDWVRKTIDDLKNSIDMGARAVKIWKNIGMDLRDENGKFVMVDHPKLDSVIDYLVKNNIPVIGHNGEPLDCWLPLEDMTFSRGYYQKHPEYHMFLHPEYPSYEDQIKARDHLLEKHPDLKFIGAHMGSLEWSLEELAVRLEKFPNMNVDLSRMPYLKLHTLNDRKKTRDFFIKYQDRLLYATDTSVNFFQEPSKFKKRVHEGWIEDWRFFVTDHLITLKGYGQLKGLKLPREVVNKIYFNNADRILGISTQHKQD